MISKSKRSAKGIRSEHVQINRNGTRSGKVTKKYFLGHYNTVQIKVRGGFVEAMDYSQNINENDIVNFDFPESKIISF